MVSLSERYRLIEDVKALVNYVVPGEAWRIRAIELQITTMHRQIAALEDALYQERTAKRYDGGDFA